MASRNDARFDPEPHSAVPDAVFDADRLAAVRATGLLDSASSQSWDGLTAIAARLMRAPMAFLTLVDETRSFWLSTTGVDAGARQNSVEESFCQYVVADRAPFVVADAAEHPRTMDNPSVTGMGVRAWAGYPLLDGAGVALGSVCVVDTVPRDWSADEIEALGVVARAASAQVALMRAVDSERGIRADKDAALARVARVIDAMPVGYLAYDADWRVTAANDEAARLVDSTVEHLIGHVLWDLFPATVGSEFDTVYRRVLSTGVSEMFEFFYPDPLNAWYEIRVQSDPPGLAVYFVDVTTRHDGEARADEILTSMPVGYVSLDAEWRYAYVNGEAARLLGLDAQDMVGRVQWELFPGLDRTEFGQVVRRVASSGQTEMVEAFYPHPDNAWYEVVIGADGNGVSAYFINVTARHEVQALLESRAEHDRSVAHTLQEVLLTDLPAVDGMELAARYHTATGADQVGGDWYDAAVQPDGALTVSIGDVSGHSMAAAATMGQLRAMLRGFVWDSDATGAQCVARLDRAVCGLHRHVTATLVTARISQTATVNGARTVSWTNAGHPAPILLHPNGSTEILDSPPELLLGVLPGTERSDHVRDLPPGSTLLLYTDGLIETRTLSLDHGTQLLRDALTRHYRLGTEQLLDAVLSDLIAEEREDDVAVLAICVNLGELPADRAAQAARSEDSSSGMTVIPPRHLPSATG